MAKLYDTDLSDAAWSLVEPLLPAAKPGGRRKVRLPARRVECHPLPAALGLPMAAAAARLPPWSTVHHHFRLWRRTGVWTRLQRAIYHATRSATGRNPCPGVVIMDGRAVKRTERGGVRGFDAHKKVKGRKRHILVDTLGLMVTNGVEPADISDRRAGEALVSELAPLWPDITIIIADAGHESRGLGRKLRRHAGWRLVIVKRKERASKITGPTWTVERTFAWLARHRRLSRDYEPRVQTSEAMLDAAAIRFMLRRLAPV